MGPADMFLLPRAHTSGHSVHAHFRIRFRSSGFGGLRLASGRHSDLRRDHRGDADSGEVVPGSFRLLVQLAPHNACAGAGGRRAHAQRCQTGHDLVDQSTVPVHFIPPRQPQPQRIITSQ